MFVYRRNLLYICDYSKGRLIACLFKLNTFSLETGVRLKQLRNLRQQTSAVRQKALDVRQKALDVCQKASDGKLTIGAAVVVGLRLSMQKNIRKNPSPFTF